MQVSRDVEQFVNHTYLVGLNQAVEEAENLIKSSMREEPARMHESVKVPLELSQISTNDTLYIKNVYFVPELVHDKVNVNGVTRQLKDIKEKAAKGDPKAKENLAHYQRFFKQFMEAMKNTFISKEDDSQLCENYVFKCIAAIDHLRSTEDRDIAKSPTLHALVYPQYRATGEFIGSELNKVKKAV